MRGKKQRTSALSPLDCAEHTLLHHLDGCLLRTHQGHCLVPPHQFSLNEGSNRHVWRVNQRQHRTPGPRLAQHLRDVCAPRCHVPRDDIVRRWRSLLPPVDNDSNAMHACMIGYGLGAYHLELDTL